MDWLGLVWKMIELLGTWLMNYDTGFDVLRYLTVRTIGGTLTALMLSIFLGPALIRFLKNIQYSQFIRGDGRYFGYYSIV